jgi:uncharacterized membrane protein
MKTPKIILSLAVAALFAFPLMTSAQAPTDLWQIDKFDVDLTVGADGITSVQETITADFLEPRHGIYRYVPVQGQDQSGKSYDLQVKFLNATMDGQAVPVAASQNGGNLVWQVGRADQTLTGKHVYVLNYEARNAIGRFSDHDEIYWNVSGTGWDVPLPRVTIKVHLPAAAVTKDNPNACYTGPYGSTATDCQIIAGGDTFGFITNQIDTPMTVSVGWPKGAVGTAPFDFASFVLTWGWLLLPVLAFLFMWRKWQKDGREIDMGPVVVQYEPPDGLRPVELLGLQAQSGGVVGKGIGPTVVDLAVRGFLSIEEVDKPGVFGLGVSKDYRLTRLKTPDEEAKLSPYDRTMLWSLFTAGLPTGGTTKFLPGLNLVLAATTPPADMTILISDLKQRFYSCLPGISKTLLDDLVGRGYFTGHPDKVRAKYVYIPIILFFIVAASAKALIGAGLSLTVLAPVIVAGIIVAVFGNYMPKWSESGAKAAWQGRGFKDFITSVEKYRAPWMEQQNIFESVLPYALACGLGEKWVKAFEGVAIAPPNWYRGATTASAFSALAFAHDLDRVSSAITTAAAGPRGTGAGSGGGGFSGGGGGGGGGGSW